MPDIKITFRGTEYTIPESRAFEVGELVENIAVIPEILGWLRRPQFFRMSRCFGEMLRSAGCDVTDKEIHRDLTAGFSKGNSHGHLEALFTLISVLMDGMPQSEAPVPGAAAPEK